MRFLIAAAVFVPLISGMTLAPPSAAAETGTNSDANSIRCYIGTETGGQSKGIYLLQLDLDSGELTSPTLVAETAYPTFLALSPDNRFLYAVTDFQDSQGAKSGGVASFSVEPGTGKLTEINRQSSGGSGPCHVSVSPDGLSILAANYTSGSVALLPTGSDGRLQPPSSIMQHTGSSVHPKRQTKPHAHYSQFDPSGRFAFAVDLGLDKVLIYDFNAGKQVLMPHDPPSANTKPGAGPRHLAFHPGGKFAYVDGELDSSVIAYDYDAEQGSLKEIQSTSTLPADFNDDNSPSEVLVHPSGKFVYVANRGHDSIAIFQVDPNSGSLIPQGHESTRGNWPRNFGIDPTGTWLIVANEKADNLSVFKIDSTTGKLDPTGNPVSIDSPMCVRFVVPSK